ncbi:ArsC family reductase [Glaciecola sp. MH2013]|uniref:ArsC family reductase n=1 Tax=Glaciecola sp. MH2013 TaxID=2785524 RepID=UPI00189E3EB2|nr:ArsC family reductase [Glaciecola sp. MH2013]MBF7072982.1 ArsC family reductase [Glaciecola sp. MH2013]
MTIMFGIPNCDTIKKAKMWLESHNVEYQFHNYRKDGLETQWLAEAESAIGWEKLLNKRGTTFRALSQEQKDNLNRESALALLEAFPAMIKRPIIFTNDQYYVGFSAEEYARIFA